MTDHMKRTRPIPADIAAQAAEDYYMELDNGCRPSIHPKAKTTGYAVYKSFLAHRAAHTHAHGPIPVGMVVDHMCGTRSCVNPAHLRLLTNRENPRRKNGVDFPLGQCRWGHSLDFQKEYDWGGVKRMACSECLREKNDRQSSILSALHQLELAYGLGGHESKRTYDRQMAERQKRVAAVADARASRAA